MDSPQISARDKLLIAATTILQDMAAGSRPGVAVEPFSRWLREEVPPAIWEDMAENPSPDAMKSLAVAYTIYCARRQIEAGAAMNVWNIFMKRFFEVLPGLLPLL